MDALIWSSEDYPEDWRERVALAFGSYFEYPFSPAHDEIWEWASTLTTQTAPRPFIAIWPRGRGKSTHAESIAADVGIRGVRQYVMYVCGTQDQADKHVATIARMLESEAVTSMAPRLGRPRMGKNGSRTWNRRTVTTESGYTVEAVGLNKAVRGQKIDWARPDLIIFDDIDEKHDSPLTIEKKESVITGSILPAGSDTCAVLFVQNLIHSDSIASKLSRPPLDSRAAQYLMDRVVSGPYPAVEGLKYEPRQEGDRIAWHITAGKSLWAGYDLTVCETEINRVGPSAYEVESQHEVDADDPNALLSEADFTRTRVSEYPTLSRVAVAIDPPASSGQCGIMGGGIHYEGSDLHGYLLEDATPPPSVKPEVWALAALQCYYRLQADLIICEVNNGGDMVESVIRHVKWEVENEDGEIEVLVDGAHVPIKKVTASRGKVTRAEPIAAVFEQGRCHHVGYFPEVEKQWRKYKPGDDSPDRLDAEVWLFTGLGLMPGTWRVAF